MNRGKPTGGCANGDKVKNCKKAALLVWLIPLGILLMSCAHGHKLNCTDIASHSGHSAEMRVGGPVFVAIDHVHAQAYVDQEDRGRSYKSWLTIKNGVLIVNSRCELQSIDARYSLEDWDYLMKNIFKHRFVKGD